MAIAQRLLLFGVTGAIGTAIAASAVERGWAVTGVARRVPAQDIAGVEHVVFDPLHDRFESTTLAAAAPFDAVCWAQGANGNDSVYNVDIDANLEMYRANCTYILVTLQALLGAAKLASPARLCVISSIWQNLARQSKLSYCMTKAALQGLVLSASADLAKDGHLINAVLPGALDTPMTRKNLSAEQIDRMTAATQFGRLPALDDVVNLVLHLCSRENTGITGQFITADLGFSHVRIV